ncbi:TetR/AcrR family transcriptional regulator [Asticcacaulis taihuensis]|uniref:TetR/AcrR family transcriptional regulator n=1 Tax=Asticcacaulis taihuensis TaxID=260084 RepID=UPI003F693C72
MEMPTKTLKGAAPFKDAPTFKDQRRDRIIQVARSVFYEVGYAGASMSMISSRLGGSKATLYAYFNSKEDLFEAIIREQCGQIADLFLAHTGTDDLRATLAVMGRELLTAIMSDEAVRTFQLIVEESHRNPQLAEMFHNVIQSQGGSNLVNLLQAAHARGQINAPNSQEAAMVLKSLIFGDCHFKRIMNLAAQPTEAHLSRQVDLAVDIFMAYYGSKSAG